MVGSDAPVCCCRCPAGYRLAALNSDVRKHCESRLEPRAPHDRSSQISRNHRRRRRFAGVHAGAAPRTAVSAPASRAESSFSGPFRLPVRSSRSSDSGSRTTRGARIPPRSRRSSRRSSTTAADSSTRTSRMNRSRRMPSSRSSTSSGSRTSSSCRCGVTLAAAAACPTAAGDESAHRVVVREIQDAQVRPGRCCSPAFDPSTGPS